MPWIHNDPSTFLKYETKRSYTPASEQKQFLHMQMVLPNPHHRNPQYTGWEGERTGKHAPPTNPKYKHLTTNSWNIQALPLNTLQIQHSVLSTLPKNRCDLPLITNIHRQNQLTHFNTHISDSHQPMNTHKPPLCSQVHDLTADFIAFRVSKVTQFINKSAVWT